MGKSNQTDLKRAKDYIDAEWKNIKSVKEIADHVGSNYNTLRAKFWRKYNVSLEQYLLTTRLENASKMLKDENFLIKQVSYELGYKDEAVFTKQFKKKYGITPKLYREKFYIESVIDGAMQRLREMVSEKPDKINQI